MKNKTKYLQPGPHLTAQEANGSPVTKSSPQSRAELNTPAPDFLLHLPACFPAVSLDTFPTRYSHPALPRLLNQKLEQQPSTGMWLKAEGSTDGLAKGWRSKLWLSGK